MHRSPPVAAFVFMNGLVKDLHSKVPMDKIKKATKHVAVGKVQNHQILPSFAMIKLLCKLIFEKLWCKTKLKQENAMHCNNRDDLLYLTFNLEISKFSEAFI